MRSRAGLMPLVVREIAHETPSIMSLRLEDPEGRSLPPWEAGAHIDIQLLTRHERQYSLCGDPSDAHGYRIAVLREPSSRGASRYIHDYLHVGSTVWVRPPRNLFALRSSRSYLLMAAGIGITPILSMARHLDSAGARWQMIYLARTSEDVAFGSQLATFGERVKTHVSAQRGRLDLEQLLSAVAPDTGVYACGPQGFVDALSSLSGSLPVACELHVERFEPKKRTNRANAAFTVECARSQVTVEVPADRSMLASLQGAGVEVAGSCLRGVCGSCAVRVLEGSPEHRDSLNADDASTTIYPCVSRSSTPRIVLDA